MYFFKNCESSDDEETHINEPTPLAPPQSHLNHNHHKERQSSFGSHHNHNNHNQIQPYTVRTSINPAYSSLISSQSGTSSSSSSTFRITASAAPTVAKLIASSSTASSSISPSTTVAASSSSVLSPSLITINSNNKLCSICLNKSINSTNSEPMVCCSTCKSFSHPNCLELNPKLVNWQCIRQYPWECMECKKCSVCSSAQDDEKMMFCDRCDRGFHTYCVNVDKVPEGSWLCTECVNAADNERIIKNFCTVNQLEETKLKESHVVLSNIAKSPLYKQVNVKTESGVLTTPNPSSNSILNSKIKNRFNSNDSLTGPPSTGEKRKGRGRPPGSLNKPKDPNSPKKSA